MLTSD
jgi:ATP-binding cassette subfamily C (CFTR/MRP) protein 1